MEVLQIAAVLMRWPGASAAHAALHLLLLLLALPLSASSDSGDNVVTVYCNVTEYCHACSARHMHAEACRDTGFAEQLSCWLQPGVGSYELEAETRKDLTTGHLPLRTSRGCSPAEAYGARLHGGWGVANLLSAWSGGGGKPAGLYIGDVAGSMGLLRFEFMMAVFLGVALPVVFWRKRQAGAARGYL